MTSVSYCVLHLLQIVSLYSIDRLCSDDIVARDRGKIVLRLCTRVHKHLKSFASLAALAGRRLAETLEIIALFSAKLSENNLDYSTLDEGGRLATLL